MYVLLDIDDTLCNTIDIWLRRYRNKYKHKLYPKDIKDWNLVQYTVPECGTKIYDFLKSKTLYNYVKPLPRALEGVNILRNLGFEIVYITGGQPEDSVYKFKWLKNNNFWKDKDHYIQTHSKFLVRGDLFIDDNYNNIISHKTTYNLLFNAPWNLKYEYKNRVSGWEEIIDTIDEYKESL